ncbi:MAG: hypothetical protein PHC28_10550 [Flavobacterium sp.]|uniref:hypothetical protein n=1 Tax=Flavobacterium sp. TaxID=239 RepID=UPI0026348A56|nr:hypothetical protein [Flavobacterium sp.]MDD5150897.1 hypothetical protein [Flavobacterium sp.]
MRIFFLISLILLSFCSAKGQTSYQSQGEICNEWIKTAKFSLIGFCKINSIEYKCHKCYKKTNVSKIIVLEYPNFNLTTDPVSAKFIFNRLMFDKKFKVSLENVYDTKCTESYSGNHLWEETSVENSKHKIIFSNKEFQIEEKEY